ncbi:PP2C family protein-serine/threonine phosphatase [Isoptericola sp. NPDC056618]|uniref:PP2C family protein-serine/threonine phosphatase n=1 Tax=Isoptericola sp. NPDC056618 TaxID=3345878 RepID=UPI0036CA0456
MSDGSLADAWSRAPVAMLRLDEDGTVLDANVTFLRWRAGHAPGQPSPPSHELPDPVVGRPLGSLITAGGRLYWEAYVAPALALNGRVEDVSLALRTPGEPLPVLVTAHRRGPAGPGSGAEIDVAMFASRGRAEFEQELVRARTSSDRWAEGLRWVQEATAALSRVAGVDQVRDALLGVVARHPGVARVTLETTAPRPSAGEAGLLVMPVDGVQRSWGHLVVVPHERLGDVPPDREALTTVVRQGAIALDRAQLAEQSVSVAHELQLAMLAGDLPERPDLDVVAEYRPATSGLTVGGDWYDVFDLDRGASHRADRGAAHGHGVLHVVIGDVVGHGLASATAMGQLRTATRALAEPGIGPAKVLDRLDMFVRHHDIGFGSTVVYAELDTANATLTYASAGHLPPLHVRRAGAAEFLWAGRSLPLGVGSAPGERTEGTVPLAPGDTVVLYTDGVVERRDAPLRDGLEHLAEHAARLAQSGESATHLVDLGTHQRDDACLIALTWHGPTPRP